MKHTIGLKLTTVTPFHYGHLMMLGGVSTISDVINDRAILFALTAAMGHLSRSLALPEKPDVLNHVRAMPWRCSLFTSKEGKLLRPLARRSDLGIEGGYQSRVRRATKTGNFKEYFLIQEVPAHQEFTGILVSDVNPFEIAGSDDFCIRIGSGRTGMLKVEMADVATARLNASTGRLFGRMIRHDYQILNEMAPTSELTAADAAKELRQWL
jgi:hypothetical protein